MENTALKIDRLKHTPLYDLHVKHGGKMVEFAGYSMPVQYDGYGVKTEHMHTREKSGIFDVSHMGQAYITCTESDPAELLEKIIPSNLIGLKDGEMQYTVILNKDGGIIDDLMVTRVNANKLFLVVNAGCKENDFKYIQEQLPEIVIERLEDRALIAIQGPKAESSLASLNLAVKDMYFMNMQELELMGSKCLISRSGYTGEDGYEISIPEDKAIEITEALLNLEDNLLIGLGARDSLRLEAGLCLYGHDITTENSPIDANIKWIIPKRRREEGGFLGFERIKSELENNTDYTRIGLKPDGRAPAREGTKIVDDNGLEIGVLTSGSFSPCLNSPISMGYIKSEYKKIGTSVNVLLRGKLLPCTVSKLPFVEQTYKRK